ncbi:MAG TPA: putative lipid II flippase FtsW [Candidatus Nanopelagicaceae bacterium]|nr:putative lipid II flippase FtsW [Candidatus Nanopelagicaceae bacterium]
MSRESTAFLRRPLAPYYVLLGSVVILTAFGVIMVLSASGVQAYEQSGTAFAIVIKQLLWVAIGVPLAWLVSRLPITTWKVLAWPLLGLALLTQILLFIPSIGRTVNGNLNWIAIGPITGQPSEFAKFALVIWGASVISVKEKILHQPKQLIFPLIPGFGLVLFLVLAGKDLGTAVILLAILVSMLLAAGASWRLLSTVGLFSALGVAALVITKGNRVRRFVAALNPFSPQNYLGAGWQPAHGVMAMASGGLFGVGLGASRQKWSNLGPEAHTDFIFAVIGEELGLIGTLLVVGLFLGIMWAGMMVALNARDAFARVSAVGITTWFTFQSVVNIGSVIGLVPVAGVPLPFVSYGGSSLVSTLIAMGFLIGLARRV